MGPEIQRPQTARPAPLHRRFRPIPRIPERGLYPGEPEACRRSLRRFLPILAHLGALAALFGVYRLEGRALLLLATTAMLALPVHYLLPFRWKAPFFVGVSMLGLGLVFGAIATAVVLGASAILIGICYLPWRWAYRAGLVAAVGLLLALGRAGGLGPEIPETTWAVLGSMFMFRMILYLYELKHAGAREPLADTLGYFFLLPNYCFVLFPVVDYRTMQRGYFSGEVHATQQAGLRLMFRGAVHLLLYRVVYHLFVIGPEEVLGVGTLAQFLVTNYGRYLHVSGQFHVACGMLHLFGYTLPETHHGYFLATGFTDYWRRINIYWKDFMVRVVFNPVAFRLKRRPQWQALAAATTAVFLATWLLHAYQSFWIGGRWGFSTQDALFWGILGALVLVNVHRDANSPRRRTLGSKGAAAISSRDRIVRAAKVAGTFTTIAVLWSLWTSPGVGPWLAMWGRAFGLSSPIVHP